MTWDFDSASGPVCGAMSLMRRGVIGADGARYAGLARGLGYDVSGGMRITGGGGELYPWEIDPGGGPVGGRRAYVASCASTQEEAGLMEDDGGVVAAGRQDGGRGRSGGRWVSPRGGIYISVVLRPGSGFEAGLLPAAASLAVRAAARAAGTAAGLRWPNDVTVGGRKAAGVMVDAEAGPGGVERAVVGIGINTDATAAAAEGELGGSAGFYGAAPLCGTGQRPAVARALLAELGRLYVLLGSGGAGRVAGMWEAASGIIGRRTIIRGAEGIAERLEWDGALVVDGRRIYAG